MTSLQESPLPRQLDIARIRAISLDLDDTLWSGILGEVGVTGVSWTLDQHSHIHGLYQQFLSSLASAGVLVGAGFGVPRTQAGAPPDTLAKNGSKTERGELGARGARCSETRCHRSFFLDSSVALPW